MGLNRGIDDPCRRCLAIRDRADRFDHPGIAAQVIGESLELAGIHVGKGHVAPQPRQCACAGAAERTGRTNNKGGFSGDVEH